MLHLLTETSIFVALPNDCLCQLTGEPIVHTAVTKKLQYAVDPALFSFRTAEYL
jgi:hypothetical protein